MNQKKSIGFIFAIIAAALSLVACIVYTQVMYKLPVVFVFLILAILVTVGLFVLSNKDHPAKEFISLLSTILIAGAAGAGFYLMVNQIGYVISGLDGIDTILSFIVYEVITIVAMIISIVGNFLPVTK